MFYAEGGDNENKDKDTLEIHDLSPDILEIILGFMYKNSIDVKNINVDLLLVCDLCPVYIKTYVNLCTIIIKT